MIRKTFATVLAVAIPRAALACPVCFGQTDSPLASATNMGIMVMLGVVGAVLSGFAAFIFHLNRRARLASGTQADPTVRRADLKVRTTSDLSSPAPQEGIAQC